jgi:hypothetical protein
VYHLQLRQFPHNLCRFNLTDAQLRPVVEPWANESWVELGERKWSPHQAKLTILEGPQMPVQQLSMGRGWRNAERRGRDVTEQVLAAARRAPAATPSASRAEPTPVALSSAPGTAPGPSPDPTLLADSLALELLALVEGAPAPLSQAWRLAQARLPVGAASDALALAEQAVESLHRRGLIVLAPCAAPAPDAPGATDAGGAGGGGLDGDALGLALRSLDSWLSDGQPGAIHIRRA